MPDDPNRDLGPFVEGMVMALVSGGQAFGGWTIELADDADGVHACYFVSPSGLRWRIRAELEAGQ